MSTQFEFLDHKIKVNTEKMKWQAKGPALDASGTGTTFIDTVIHLPGGEVVIDWKRMEVRCVVNEPPLNLDNESAALASATRHVSEMNFNVVALPQTDLGVPGFLRIPEETRYDAASLSPMYEPLFTEPFTCRRGGIRFASVEHDHEGQCGTGCPTLLSARRAGKTLAAELAAYARKGRQ